MIVQIDSAQTLTQFQLKSRINKQPIPISQPGNPLCTLYYTLCRKKSLTISVLTNSRLLIFKQPSNTLFYINYDEQSKCPFAVPPKIKNNQAHITQAIIKKDWEQKDGNILVVLFNKNKSKNNDKNKSQIQTIEWSFQMPVKLVQAWEKLIIQKKQKALIQAVVGNVLGIDNLLGSQSKVQSPKQIKLPPPQPSKIPSPKRQKQVQNLDAKKDWNLEFINNHNIATVKRFNQYAQYQFMAQKPQIIKFNNSQQSIGYPQKSAYTDRNNSQILQHRKNNSNIKIIKLTNIVLFIAGAHSPQAIYLKQQFDNYHYIVKCCRDKQFCIGVPLACIIYYKGLVCLSKSILPNQNSIISKQQLQQNNPQSNKILNLFKQLQQHTKIKAEVVINNSIILNVTNIYPFALDQQYQPRIFIDQLTILLPHYPKLSTFASFSSCYPLQSPTPLINPCLLYHNFNNIIHPRDNQTHKEITYFTDQAAKQLAQCLIQGRVVLGAVTDLRDLVEIFRLKIEFLPLVLYYINMRTKVQQCKYIKKLFTNALLCDLIIQKYINPILKESCQSENNKQSKIGALQFQIEQIITNFCGSSSESSQSRSTQKWKQVQKQFKKQYGFSLNKQYVNSGVLLSGLIDSINGLTANCNSFHNKQQKLHIQFKPLNFGFGQVSSTIQQKIISLIADANINKVQQIINIGVFDQQNFDHYLSDQNKDKLLIYLSSFISPLDTNPPKYNKLSTMVYSAIEQLHDTQSPLKFKNYCITKNYLMHYGKYLSKQQLSVKYKQKYKTKYTDVIDKLKLEIQQWYRRDHPYLSEILYLESSFMDACEKDGNMALTCLTKAVQLWENQVGKLKGQSLIKYYAAIGKLGISWGDMKTARKGLQGAKDVLQSMEHHGTLNNTQLYVQILCELAKLQLSQLSPHICLKHIPACIRKIQKSYKYKSILRNPLSINQNISSQTINISKLYQQNIKLYKLYVNILCTQFRAHQIQRNVAGMCQDVGIIGKIIHLQCQVKRNMQENVKFNVDQRVVTCVDICVSGILYKVWHQPAGIQKLQNLNKLIKTTNNLKQNQHSNPIFQLLNMIPSNLTLPEHFSHLINKLIVNSTNISDRQQNSQAVKFVYLLNLILNKSMEDKIINVYQLFQIQVQL